MKLCRLIILFKVEDHRDFVHDLANRVTGMNITSFKVEDVIECDLQEDLQEDLQAHKSTT